MVNLNSLKLEKAEEFCLSLKVRNQLQELLHRSFPGFFDTRIYAKQLPTFRILVWNQSDLIAQIAIDHRAISIDGEPASIFGIVDLCVDDSMKLKGIASKLLEETENLAIQNGIDYLLLFADDHRLYHQFGFELCDCTCCWVGIDEHKTLKVLNRKLGDCMMLKPLRNQGFPQQSLDLLGHLF